MSPFSVYSCAEVEAHRVDAAWGSLRWLAAGDIGNAEGPALGRVIIRGGRANRASCP